MKKLTLYDATTSAMLEMVYLAEIHGGIGVFTGSIEVLYGGCKVVNVVDGQYCTVKLTGCRFSALGENTTVTCEMRRATENLPWHIVEIQFQNINNNVMFRVDPGSWIPGSHESLFTQYERLVETARGFVIQMLQADRVTRYTAVDAKDFLASFMRAFLPLPTVRLLKDGCLAIKFGYKIPGISEVGVVFNATSIIPTAQVIKYEGVSSATQKFTLLANGVITSTSG